MKLFRFLVALTVWCGTALAGGALFMALEADVERAAAEAAWEEQVQLGLISPPAAPQRTSYATRGPPATGRSACVASAQRTRTVAHLQCTQRRAVSGHSGHWAEWRSGRCASAGCPPKSGLGSALMSEEAGAPKMSQKMALAYGPCGRARRRERERDAK